MSDMDKIVFLGSYGKFVIAANEKPEQIMISKTLNLKAVLFFLACNIFCNCQIDVYSERRFCIVIAGETCSVAVKCLSKPCH